MKFDYSNIYKHNNKVENKELEKTKKEEIKEEVKEEVKEEIKEEIKEEVAEKKYGQVYNCELLNVRTEPNLNSEIFSILNRNDKVEILDDILDFYKILKDGSEVYCMKKYIKIV